MGNRTTTNQNRQNDGIVNNSKPKNSQYLKKIKSWKKKLVLKTRNWTFFFIATRVIIFLRMAVPLLVGLATSIIILFTRAAKYPQRSLHLQLNLNHMEHSKPGKRLFSFGIGWANSCVLNDHCLSLTITRRQFKYSRTELMQGILNTSMWSCAILIIWLNKSLYRSLSLSVSLTRRTCLRMLWPDPASRWCWAKCTKEILRICF